MAGPSAEGATLQEPPYNVRMEMAVLAGVIYKPEIFPEVSAILKADDFFREDHAGIWRLIVAESDAGRSFEPIIISDWLIQSRGYEASRACEIMGEIMEAVYQAFDIPRLADGIAQLATMRAIIETSNQTIREVYSRLHVADDLVDRFQARALALGERRTRREPVPIAQAAVEAIRIFDQAVEDGLPPGIATGFDEVDEMIGGLKSGQLIVIAGRPAMGKTAYGLNVAEHVAERVGLPVLFVSQEMSRVELANRFLSARAEVEGRSFLKPRSALPGDRERIGEAAILCSGLPIWIDDTPGLTASQVATTARRLKMREKNLAMVVVDYLQLLEPEVDRENATEQVARTCRRLKKLARELDVPVVALAQLNRESENRDDKRPRLKDLKQSGQIEQDASVVLLLHRPSYYDPAERPGMAEIIVAKNRSGRSGSAYLEFEGRFTRFKNPRDPMVDHAF